MNHIEPIRVALWDVRAQWESGVRQLTATQTRLERSGATGVDDVTQNDLRRNLRALKEINCTVRALLEQVERALNAAP